VKVQWKCIYFNFRYASVKLFFNEPLKIILLVDEDYERGDSIILMMLLLIFYHMNENII